MSLSLSEAKQQLLSGKSLSWAKYGDHKAGSVHLENAGARRLFHYLLSCNQLKVAEASETLFDDLIAAWENTAFDPADTITPSKSVSATGPWRLARVETSGFGGLNFVDGPTFVMPFEGENWCLEGQNGSGKTSVASAIIWALTGYRCRDQDGLVLEQGVRTPVYDESGAKIGDWPAVVAYPTSPAELAGTAETWVRLTFHDPDGNVAEAYRRLVAPPDVDPDIKSKIDPELLAMPQLLEVGLLMPARLSRIGFGEKSQSIYEAVKLLTGLDQLASIAEGASNFSHKAKRFRKYAVDNGIDAIETKLELYIARAIEESKKVGFDLKIVGKREEKEYAQELRGIAQSAAKQAAKHLEVLESDIADNLDTNIASDRTNIKNAVSRARGILQESSKGVVVFDAWKALGVAQRDSRFQMVPDVLGRVKEELADAILWDKRQSEDHKLRLKALASRFFDPAPHSHEDPDCPLCESKLSGEKRQALAAELTELKTAAETAERKLADVCVALEKKIHELLPQDLDAHFTLLVAMQPRDAFLAAAKERFSEAPPFSTVLIGMAELATELATTVSEKLPEFTHVEAPPQFDVPSNAKDLLNYILEVERVFALVSWWQTHRDQFVAAWSELKGIAPDEGSVPVRSLEGKLGSLEAALEKATPLDDLAKALNEAAVEADKWLPVYERQLVREAIAEALKPLKDLRGLVATATASSISSLSTRMKAVLERIHFRERLSFEDAAISKKTVHISGSFDKGVRIDASVVANSSWLRAILWSFIIALREQTIEAAEANPFPLLVLDDPQTSFDQRNKRKWAEEIARLGNTNSASLEAAQVLIITYERQFFQMLVNSEKLTGQQGLVVRLCDTSKVTTVIFGGSLARSYDDAVASNNDEKGHAYVGEVRTYCEGLLKIMLRAEGPEVCNMSIDQLAEIMKLRREGSVPPFTNPSFQKLLDLIAGGGGGKPMQFINEAHHNFDGTIGVAQASDVRDFWEKKLQSQLHTCFKIFAEFEAYVGEPRLFSWMENVVDLPASNAEEMKKNRLLHTGVATAAKTDGRAGDGLITMEDLPEAQQITLHNHTAYQVASSTLDPVADIGDIIIVSKYAKVRSRNLVVTAFENQLLARRYNETEVHPHVAVLTGQTTDPTTLVEPVIAPKERISPQKIVGTLFAKSKLPIPPKDENAEFIALTDTTVVRAMLQNAKLFKVSGRSAEPVALDGQFIMTHPIDMTTDITEQMSGRPVIAVDETGARYFKRFQPQGNMIVLESLNSDGMAPAELLSFEREQGFPKLSKLMEVVGVLFELP